MATYTDDARFDEPYNVHPLERAASLGAGTVLAWRGLMRDTMGGVALMLVGGLLLHRGVWGRCPGYQAAGISTALPEVDGGDLEDLEGEEIYDVEDLQADEARFAGEGGATKDNVVDEASDESFPASDAPSWTPTTSVEPEQL